MGDDGAPIAVVGSGVAGIAAVTNLFLQIAGSSPEGSPPVTVVWLAAHESGPKGNAPYPLNGRNARYLHPFASSDVFNEYGRRNFGKYVDDMVADDPGLRTALPAPTWRQIYGYLQFQLDLSIIDLGDKAKLDVNRTAIRDIQPTTQDGPATILFADDTTLRVRRAIRAIDPPHMAGEPVMPDMEVAMEIQFALSSSGLQVALTHERGAPEPITFTIAAGGRRIVLKPLDLPDEELRRHVANNLLPRLGQSGGTELWVATQYSVAESVAAQFRGDPVRFLALWQFAGLLETLKLSPPA